MSFAQPTQSELKPSILIVDDDSIILEILGKGFNMCGFKVFTAENGVDALQLFKRERINIVLTDIYMPGKIDGTQLSTLIHRQSPDTTIAAMTGGNGEVGRILLKKGIVDHLFIKPFAISYACKTLIG